MHVSIPFARIFRAIAVTGALAVVLGPLAARADLCINLKSPTRVSGVKYLTGQGCELMQRNAKEDVVHCGNRNGSWDAFL